LSGSIKEKYGTIRFSPLWFDGTLHSLIYPGHYFIRFPKWFYWNVDYLIIKKVIYYSGLYYLINKWQKYVYGKAYEKAMKTFPHIVDEIVEDSDYPELIKGGMEIHNKYWTKL
jgi:hypothetical protein